MRRSGLVAVAFLILALTGCTVGPNYQRPIINTPPVFRGDTTPPASGTPAGVQSLGDEKWFQVFDDQVLQQLVRTALKQNFDLRIAATRVLQAQQQVTITRSNQYPNVTGNVSVAGTRQPGIPGVFRGYSYLADQIGFSASWNVDFWGRYRRATEASRATLLATEWGRRAVISSLLQNIATAYFSLRELDAELEIAQRSLTARQDSLKLTQTLEQGGATSLVDVRQAEQLVEQAAAAIPDTERLIAQAEDQLSILIGENPHAIPRGKPITEQPLPQVVPAGLPSRLLERRPDIQANEQDLVAANAQIGVARAQLFPELPLTGSAGLLSIGLGNLFDWPLRTWNWTAPLTQQIFNAGALRANVRLSEAQQQQALLTYQQSIQAAFREVSDALIGYQKYREFRVRQEALTSAARGASDLAKVRYQGGVTAYLEVLTNDTNLFTAELNLARARLGERVALVQIYNSLGGGWEQ